jgi:hypothetical protein
MLRQETRFIAGRKFFSLIWNAQPIQMALMPRGLALRRPIKTTLPGIGGPPMGLALQGNRKNSMDAIVTASYLSDG